MTKFAAMCGTAIAIFIYSAPAHAQAQAIRTWVSGVGDDTNSCGRSDPCKTFAGAIFRTTANGEINCLDPGGFGAVTILHSITINCVYTGGGLAAASGNGIVVNTELATDIVTLRGLSLGAGASAAHGINVRRVGALHIHNVQIRGFRLLGSGIYFAPSNAGAELYVSDSYLTDNGNSTTTGGIVIQPSGSGSAKVSINRVQIERNAVGVRIDGTGTTGEIRAFIRNSTILGSTNNGVLSSASTAVNFVFLARNGIFGNNIGIQSDGANSKMEISGNTIIGNLGIGMSMTADGTIQSYGNNEVSGNFGGDGTTTGANFSLK